MSPTASSHRDLERARVRFAYGKVNAWRGSKHWDKTVPLLRGLPVTLRSQGVILTVATLLKGEEKAQHAVAQALAEWLLGKSPVQTLTQNSGEGTDGAQALLQTLIQSDRPTYMAAQRQAQGLLKDLKLLADALHVAKSEESSS